MARDPDAGTEPKRDADRRLAIGAMALQRKSLRRKIRNQGPRPVFAPAMHIRYFA
jgi:hypothetical protein